MLDARAGLAAMVYRRLRSRRDLGVAVGLDARPARLGGLEVALHEHFPEARLGDARTVRSRLDGQLQQEIQIERLNWLMMCLCGVIGSAAMLMLGAAALRRQTRALGTRRALGASKWHLVRTTLLGPRPSLWWAFVLGAPAVTAVALRLLDAQQSEWLPASVLAVSVVAVWGACITLVLLRQIDDEQLISSLKA